MRYFADRYGIDKNKVLIMGSSAGGHLAALTSTYFEEINDYEINDEISRESFIPDGWGNPVFCVNLKFSSKMMISSKLFFVG